MMGNIMEYKGYHTKIEFDAESKTLRGKIEGINDYIDLEASDILNIELEFHAAVGKIQNGSIKEHLTFGFLQNFIKNWHCVHLKMDVLLMQRSNFFARELKRP